MNNIVLPRGVKLPRVLRLVKNIEKRGLKVPESTPINDDTEIIPEIQVDAILPPTTEAVVKTNATLEEFTLTVSFVMPEIRKRLTLKIRGKTDEQQFFAACKIAWWIGVKRHNCQIIAPTGQGKTFVCAATLAILAKFFPDRFDPMQCLMTGRMPPIVIQPAKALTQTRQILVSFGIDNVIITTIASLRASLGESMLEFKTVIVNDQPTQYPFWHIEKAPPIIWFDESQFGKNDSIQTSIIESAALAGIPVVPASGTPYSRPCQAKLIAIILQPEISPHIFLTPKLWPSFVKDCCPTGYEPTDWTPKGISRVQEFLEPYTVRWAIDYPYPVKVRMCACRFPSEASRERYDIAFQEWNEKRMAFGKNPLVGFAAVMVSLQKFNQVAEEERVDPLVRYALDEWVESRKKGKPVSIILAFCHRTSLDKALGRLRGILGESEFKRHVAQIVGGMDCSSDHAAFQSDRKTILLLTIACGGAALSLDHNSKNRNPRKMYTSAVWNDIQMAQLGGRTQRLDTRSVSWMYVMYFVGTEEVRKIQKTRRKLRSLKEIVTSIGTDNHTEGSGTLVGDLDGCDHVNMGKLAPPSDDDAEELAANEVIGSKARVELDIDDEEDEYQ